MDKFSKEKRSDIMSHVRGKNTKPEEAIRKYLFSKGFWHQHPGCKSAALPETNRDYWKAKLQRNVERDAVQIRQLEEMGWYVIVLWECEISSKSKRKERLISLVNEIEHH